MNLPGYWEVREKCGAFSAEHLDEACPDEISCFFVEVGLQNHLAITSIAGAKEFSVLLRKLLLLNPPNPILVWEFFACSLNALYKACNGLMSFSFAMLFPESILDVSSIVSESGYNGIGIHNYLPGGIQVKDWFCSNYPKIQQNLLRCSNSHKYRHLDVHSWRNLIRLSKAREGLPWELLVLSDPNLRPARVSGSDTAWKNGVLMLDEAIETHERCFEEIYHEIISVDATRDFLERYEIVLRST